MSYLAICCVLESLLPGADLVLLLRPGAEEAGHHRESPDQVDAGGTAGHEYQVSLNSPHVHTMEG